MQATLRRTVIYKNGVAVCEPIYPGSGETVLIIMRLLQPEFEWTQQFMDIPNPRHLAEIERIENEIEKLKSEPRGMPRPPTKAQMKRAAEFEKWGIKE